MGQVDVILALGDHCAIASENQDTSLSMQSRNVPISAK